MHTLSAAMEQPAISCRAHCLLRRIGRLWDRRGRLSSQDEPINVQSALMKQPNTQQLRSLRLSALARDDRTVAELNSRISNSPDYLVEELMTRHGWPAHEALCAVQQLQEEALRGTSDQQAS